MGIIVCGLNGSGKSTLAKALAQRINYHLIDIEDIYFPRKNDYGNARSKKEVEKLLLEELQRNPNFILAAVTGDYGDETIKLYEKAIFIDVCKSERMKRIEQRSYLKFGTRMLEGGDLYAHEKTFFDIVEARDEQMVKDWLTNLSCDVLSIDGTLPIEQNVDWLLEMLNLQV